VTVQCPSCGATFTEDHSFCGICGTRLPTGAEPPPDVPERDPLVGHIIDGRYRVLAKLGEGGMGAVYKVEHVHMGKYMAMKLLLREYSGNRDLVRRFRREAQAVSKLSHVNTVQVFDFGRSGDGAMYMVMEYIQGENLASVLTREGPMRPSRVARIVSQICASLAEAHGLGIVHRDLKPENVMLVRSREQRDFVKVLDFGLAKLREREEGATSHGSLVGTPYYMSPEQIRGADIDPRSDIYSLGAVAFKMLTGEPPFKAPSPIGVLTKHLQEAPPHMRQVRPDIDIPEGLESVLHRAMAKERESRFQTVDDLRRSLEMAVADRTPSGVSQPRVSGVAIEAEPEWSLSSELNLGNRDDFDRLHKRLRRRRLFRVAVLLFILCGAGGALAYGYFEGGWFERQSESEPNHHRRDATPLPLGRSIKGFIGKRISDEVGDVDWFRVRHPGGSRQLLHAELTGVPNIDLVLDVFEGTDSKRPLWSANETGVGGPEAAHSLRFDKTLYLRVQEVPVKGKPPTENISDPYFIRATARSPQAGEEIEPNDDIFSATDVPGPTARGLLSRKGDRDYFRFPRAGTEGETFRISLVPPPSVQVALEAIAGGLRLPDKLPGVLTLPSGDRSLFVMVRAQAGANAATPYLLTVERLK
jgi:serine/threonine-protein kinase